MSQGWRMGQLMHYLGIRWLTFFSSPAGHSPIPQPLVELLSDRSLVWTSPCWKGLLESSFRAGTVTSYTSAQRRYVAFCDTLNLPPLPLSERALCLFVAYLTHQGLAHQSIITYLSGEKLGHCPWGGTRKKGSDAPPSTCSTRGSQELFPPQWEVHLPPHYWLHYAPAGRGVVESGL